MAINLLSPKIYNRIAAGEVVERPASVVKELVENSLDAGASSICVEISGGGIEKIEVSDNGCGIAKADLPLAFLPHATSKIKDIEDLDCIGTMGFRGEALASIASVSRVTLSTKTADEETGHIITADGGDISQIKEAARLNGTKICVCNLFYNTPARAKFLKKPKTEESEVTHLMEKFMLSHPEIEFCYIVDGKEVYRHACGTLEEVIYLIYGREVHDNLVKLNYQEDGISVEGYITSPKLSRPNRTYQTLFVNGRFVENYMISACVQGAFEPLLMKGRFPIYTIKLDIPLDRVDVNVHPNKREVKFDNSSLVFGVVRRAVEAALLSTNLIADFEIKFKDEKDWESFDIKNDQAPARTGFNSFQKTNIDPLSSTEGASYVAKVDSDNLSKEIATAKDYKKSGIDIINMPDFASVKNNQKTPVKNRPGGNIFFDQSGDSLLREVEIAVEKQMQQKSTAASEETNAFKTQKVQADRFIQADASEVSVLGVAFKTYIIAQFGESLYVIDQHAMHERQNYDALKAQIENNNVAKQGLLVPYKLNLVARDAQILHEKLDALNNLGFEIEQKQNEFCVKSVPAVLTGINLNEFLQEALMEKEDVKTASGFLNEKLCQSACKHSIRAGDSVSKEEIYYLINKIKDGVPLCPHGRPIILKITKKDLEKMFKRTL